MLLYINITLVYLPVGTVQSQRILHSVLGHRRCLLGNTYMYILKIFLQIEKCIVNNAIYSRNSTSNESTHIIAPFAVHFVHKKSASYFYLDAVKYSPAILKQAYAMNE